MPFDLILRGGRVIDPSQKSFDGRDGDTGLAAGARWSRSENEPLEADPGTDVRDVSGYIVTPGLIDLYTHVYWGGTSLGIDAEEFCRTSGVTTAVDTGSAGSGQFRGLPEARDRAEPRKSASSLICMFRTPASSGFRTGSWSARARSSG